MAKKDAWKRYLEAGTAFTQITRARAEDLVQDLVKSGVLQRKEAQVRVEELLERSRQGSEALLNLVRDEVTTQLHAVGIASVEDLARQVAGMLGRTSPAPASRTAATRTAAKKAPAKKTAAKKAPAKKAPAPPVGTPD